MHALLVCVFFAVVVLCHGGGLQQQQQQQQRQEASERELGGPAEPGLLGGLQHWGRLAAATYQRFEDWDSCEACQEEDIRDTELWATWSTKLPAFSRGFVGVDHGRRQVVVVFRGSTHVMDALSDARIIQVPWPHAAGSSVHWGFLLAYQAAQPHIGRALEATRRALEGYSLHFVGHSLGAAQATLAFVDFMGNTTENSAQLVTFGAPRVGNREFARLVSEAAGAASEVIDEGVLRVVHEHDIVAHLPRRSLLLSQYAHAGREIWARDGDGTKASELIVCQCVEEPAEEDPDCSSGTSPLRWSILDHMEYPGMRLGIPQYVRNQNRN